jgi:hypothetical protein
MAEAKQKGNSFFFFITRGPTQTSVGDHRSRHYYEMLNLCLICKLETGSTVTGGICILNPRLRVCGSGWGRWAHPPT